MTPTLTYCPSLTQQKIVPARAYAWSSALAVLLVAATGLGRVVLHFTEKVCFCFFA